MRGKEAWSINRESMDKNRIDGAAKQGEEAMNHEFCDQKGRRHCRSENSAKVVV